MRGGGNEGGWDRRQSEGGGRRGNVKMRRDRKGKKGGGSDKKRRDAAVMLPARTLTCKYSNETSERHERLTARSIAGPAAFNPIRHTPQHGAPFIQSMLKHTVIESLCIGRK